MTRAMKLWVPLLFAAALHAAVEGVVVNGTTGKPHPGATVALVKPSAAGMESLGSTTSDAEGRFRFQNSAGGPALVQTLHQGVSYSRQAGGQEGSRALVLQVYDSTLQPDVARVAQHAVLLSPEGTSLIVREHIVCQNDTTKTFNDPAHGSLRIRVPAEGKDTLRVSARTLSGVPLLQSAVPAGEPNIFKVAFPLKPGTTAFDVAYALPLPAGGVFSGRALETDAKVRLVVPPGFALEGDGVELLGVESKTQTSNYRVLGPEYAVKITRTGQDSSPDGEEESAPAARPVLPRIYDHVYPILGLAFMILALGMLLHYRRDLGSEQPPIRRITGLQPSVVRRAAPHHGRLQKTA